MKSRSSDGTQVAGACGNGHVIFAHVIEKRHSTYLKTVSSELLLSTLLIQFQLKGGHQNLQLG